MAAKWIELESEEYLRQQLNLAITLTTLVNTYKFFHSVSTTK